MRLRSAVASTLGRTVSRLGVLLIACVVFSLVGRAQVTALVALARFAFHRQDAGSDPKALEKALASMDTAAASFHALQANFVWLQYTKVVDDKDYQKGTIYYRRQGKGIEMMADITDPQKAVLYRDGKVQVAQPNSGITPYDAGKNREAVESFLVLGFGGSGHDLVQQFDVKYLGSETVDGIKAAELELTPKSERVKKVFDRILLWIDPARGISLQQQFFEPTSGNYRLATYTNVQFKQKLDDSIFKLPNYAPRKVSGSKN